MCLKVETKAKEHWLAAGQTREEWERLAAAVELGEGFQLFALQVPDPHSETVLVDLLQAFTGELGWHLERLDLSALRAETAVVETLAAIDRAARPCVFLSLSGALLGTAGELSELFLYLNQKRDVLAERIKAPFLLSLHPEDWLLFRRRAPDFWSIHQSMYRFSGVLRESVPGNDMIEEEGYGQAVEAPPWSFQPLPSRATLEALWESPPGADFHGQVLRGQSQGRRSTVVRSGGAAPRLEEFTGRVSGLEALETVLHTQQPLVAILGAAGIGKTALVQVVLQRLAHRYPEEDVVYLSVPELGETPAQRIRRARQAVVVRLLPTFQSPTDEAALRALYHRVTAGASICADCRCGSRRCCWNGWRRRARKR